MAIENSPDWKLAVAQSQCHKMFQHGFLFSPKTQVNFNYNYKYIKTALNNLIYFPIGGKSILKSPENIVIADFPERIYQAKLPTHRAAILCPQCSTLQSARNSRQPHPYPKSCMGCPCRNNVRAIKIKSLIWRRQVLPSTPCVVKKGFDLRRLGEPTRNIQAGPLRGGRTTMTRSVSICWKSVSQYTSESGQVVCSSLVSSRPAGIGLLISIRCMAVPCVRRVHLRSHGCYIRRYIT